MATDLEQEADDLVNAGVVQPENRDKLLAFWRARDRLRAVEFVDGLGWGLDMVGPVLRTVFEHCDGALELARSLDGLELLDAVRPDLEELRARAANLSDAAGRLHDAHARLQDAHGHAKGAYGGVAEVLHRLRDRTAGPARGRRGSR